MLLTVEPGQGKCKTIKDCQECENLRQLQIRLKQFEDKEAKHRESQRQNWKKRGKIYNSRRRK